MPSKTRKAAKSSATETEAPMTQETQRVFVEAISRFRSAANYLERSMFVPSNLDIGKLTQISEDVKNHVIDESRSALSAIREAVRQRAREPWFRLTFLNEEGQDHDFEPEYVKGWHALAAMFNVSVSSIRVSMSNWENHNRPVYKKLQPMTRWRHTHLPKLYPCIAFPIRDEFWSPPEGAIIRTHNPPCMTSSQNPTGAMLDDRLKKTPIMPQVQLCTKHDRGMISLYIRSLE